MNYIRHRLLLIIFFQVNWGLWDMPKIVCDFYIASDVICSTSSIFNLVAISIDRQGTITPTKVKFEEGLIFSRAYLPLYYNLYYCRYYAVTSPITYSQHKDKTARAYITIVLCWLLSIGIGKQVILLVKLTFLLYFPYFPQAVQLCWVLILFPATLRRLYPAIFRLPKTRVSSLSTPAYLMRLQATIQTMSRLSAHFTIQTSSFIHLWGPFTFLV